MLIFLQTFLVGPRALNGGSDFHSCMGAPATMAAQAAIKPVAQGVA